MKKVLILLLLLLLKKGFAEEIIKSGNIQVEIDPEKAVWSVENLQTEARLSSIRPRLDIKDLSVDLSTYKVKYSVKEITDSKLGKVTSINIKYKKAKELDITYTIFILKDGNEVVAKLDFVNKTGKKLIINKTVPIDAKYVSLKGSKKTWTAMGDGKRYKEPHKLEKVSAMKNFDCWWYFAVRDQLTKHSVLMGSLENNKGLGRFFAESNSGDSIRVEGYYDYEDILMPAEESIQGELMVINFGRNGLDSLDRFGELIAKVHDIHLMRDHPIDPYDTRFLRIFNSYMAWGSSVIDGFTYKKYNSRQYRLPCYDRQWANANWNKVIQLGLKDYGYCVDPPKGTVAYAGIQPLARKYGYKSGWVGGGILIKNHSDWYKEGKIDFSNPEVVDFERERVRKAFEGKKGIVTYNWDFTDDWQKLNGQYDPFMTSAETYRIAMGIWREEARNHQGGGFATVMMNVPGINYDMVDSLRVGQDSDRGYYPKDPPEKWWHRECTFIRGLVRQASGRFFYNGKVWWTNPDSFHVYAGGLYTYNQGKVHASFNAIAGNRAWLAEPFIEYEEDFPEDRLEIIKRVAPVTHDVSKAVDVFENNPARFWNMPVERKFGKWNVVGFFNFDFHQKALPVTKKILFEELELCPEKEYLVYEFWNKKFLGVKKGSFTRTLLAPDCEIYSVIEKKDHPVLVSTSRHVRHMAYDIVDLNWDEKKLTLSGTSKVVKDDPYQLRIYLPKGYSDYKSIKADDLTTKVRRAGPLLLVNFNSDITRDVNWSTTFVKNHSFSIN